MAIIYVVLQTDIPRARLSGKTCSFKTTYSKSQNDTTQQGKKDTRQYEEYTENLITMK